MNAVDDYARRLVKRGNEEIDTLSEFTSIGGILKSPKSNMKPKCPTIYFSVFSKSEVINRLHEEYVLVPTDKACNNIVFVMLTIKSVS
jgi:hypothetical protein